MENDPLYTIIGVLVFVVFGGLIGWLVYRHIKYTIAGTKAGAKALKDAVVQVGDEFKIANERKKQGLGWTVPQEMVDQRAANVSMSSGREEIVFGHGSGPPSAPTERGAAMANEEVVFDYNEEQMKTERKEQAGKGVIAGIVLLVFAGVFILAGVLSGGNAKKMAAYPTVQARVTNHTEKVRLDEDGDEYTQHYVDIEWVVDGKTYTETDRPSNEYGKDAITVHYKPGKPEKIYSEAQVQDEGNVYWYVIAGIVGLLGLGIAILGKKDKAKLEEGQ